MKMTNIIERFFHDHTVLSDNQALDEKGFIAHEALGILLRVLYPVCPHITHVLWQQLGYAAVLGDLLDADWPKVDAEALKQDEIELVVQVNGKLRGSILVPAKADKAAIEATALSSETVEKFISDHAVKKIIIVPGKLVNIVI
jgi:leucyl-tRNA synthetase